MDKSPNFTPRELHLINYYKDAKLSRSWASLDHLSFLVPSLVLFALYLVKEEEAYLFIAYGLLVWRNGWLMFATPNYSADLRSIIQKYEAATDELSREREKKAEA